MTQNQLMVNILDEDNKINENTLNFKDNDYNKIIDVLTIIAKSIESIPEIKFDKIEIHDDEFEINKLQRNISIENSRLIKLKIHYKLVDNDGNLYLDEKTGKELRPTIDLLIPRLMHGTFLINDVLYYPMLQILDYKGILKANSVLIKTLMNKLKVNIKRSKKRIRRVVLDWYKKKDIPLWLVFFTTHTPIEAMKRVFRTNDIEFLDGNVDDTITDTNTLYVNYLNKHIKISNINQDNDTTYTFFREVMKESLQEFFIDKSIKVLLEKLNKRLNDNDMIFNTSDVFLEILGSYFATNSNRYHEKGKNVQSSIIRFLDDISKSYFKVDDLMHLFMNELERINLHNIALETLDEETLEKNNANNLLSKRVRMSEYIIYPFTKKLSENMHSVLNGNTKDNIKINKILNIFKIDKNIIISGLLKNNLVRYCEQTNSMFAISKSKASFISGSNVKAEVMSDELKSVPRTAIDRIDMITTSTGDSVGLTFSLSATNKKLFDDAGLIL